MTYNRFGLKPLPVLIERKPSPDRRLFLKAFFLNQQALHVNIIWGLLTQPVCDKFLHEWKNHCWLEWNDPLKLHKSEQTDQSVLRGVRG